jgi:hypothetical protein
LGQPLNIDKNPGGKNHDEILRNDVCQGKNVMYYRQIQVDDLHMEKYRKLV